LFARGINGIKLRECLIKDDEIYQGEKKERGERKRLPEVNGSIFLQIESVVQEKTFCPLKLPRSPNKWQTCYEEQWE
jgi:hypothetical protein